MPFFGKTSRSRLDTCHEDLQRLFEIVVMEVDCSVLCGYRDEEDQNRALRDGKSKKKFPESKHNWLPSIAVDVAPYPIAWHDMDRFYHFGGFVKATSIHLGIKIRWGGDWDRDYTFKDQNFHDLPHFELVL